MIKKVYVLLMFILLIFSNIVYATNVNDPEKIIEVRRIEITELDEPVLDATPDKDIVIKRSDAVYVTDIVWYKNGKTMYSSTFDEYGTYTCRIYLKTKVGYKMTNWTEVYHGGDNIRYSEMGDGYFLEISYTINPPVIRYPSRIVIKEFVYPKIGGSPDYSAAAGNPEFYQIKKIEWYNGTRLMQDNEKFVAGTYKSRVYLDLINGFTVKNNLEVITNDTAILVVTSKDVYIETEYTILPADDEKCISLIDITFKDTPYFGKEKDKMNISAKKSKYYEIDEIVWYKNSAIMYDKYFTSGTYKCRVYIKFMNEGYPASPLMVFAGDSVRPKPMSSQNGRYFVERTFTINQPYIKTFEFNDLNLPEFGGIQDTKLASMEPGMYTPSMVYWYKDNKYMSNVDTFKEGIYRCKFTLNVNNECIISEEANAKINGLKATVTQEYNTITVEMEYEVKKPNIMWTNSSDWAKTELESALNNALIPKCLNQKDYTSSITRAEFAAVAVRMYERLSLKTANPIESNPFTDTSDVEVLKAYALGITNGTSDTTFEPNSLITRQEMATMMVRALAKSGVNTSVNISNVSKFVDHNNIDSWALEGVYFMSNIGIIKGVGNNTFDVHGNATREAALAISIRSVNKFK